MYSIYLSHHSISQSPTYLARTLRGAKRLGTLKFGDGFRDQQINIVDEATGERVAWRLAGDATWKDYSK
jgi:hypothetical protein